MGGVQPDIAINVLYDFLAVPLVTHQPPYALQYALARLAAQFGQRKFVLAGNESDHVDQPRPLHLEFANRFGQIVGIADKGGVRTAAFLLTPVCDGCTPQEMEGDAE